jgi:hypothetical protein
LVVVVAVTAHQAILEQMVVLAVEVGEVEKATHQVL